MTKKHFRAIAAALYNTKQYVDANEMTPKQVLDRCTLIIANACEQINPRFDRSKFIEACEKGL